jgi:hypothetical protein
MGKLTGVKMIVLAILLMVCGLSGAIKKGDDLVSYSFQFFPC